MSYIGIIDYDAGNLQSISKAVAKVGGKYDIVAKGDLRKYDKLIIPGVGAYIEGMRNLEARKLIEPISQFAKDGKPILGICLGMQLFTQEGTEFGIHKGLGLLNGKAVSLKKYVKEKVSLPHMGWNPLLRTDQGWGNTVLLHNIPVGCEVYFVHSYFVDLEDKRQAIATTEYGGFKFASVVRKENIFGTQFHPEKSGEIGLKILKNFIGW